MEKAGAARSQMENFSHNVEFAADNDDQDNEYSYTPEDDNDRSHIQKFLESTNITDQNVAILYLKQNKNNLNDAIGAYFRDNKTKVEDAQNEKEDKISGTNESEKKASALGSSPSGNKVVSDLESASPKGSTTSDSNVVSSLEFIHLTK